MFYDNGGVRNVNFFNALSPITDQESDVNCRLMTMEKNYVENANILLSSMDTSTSTPDSIEMLVICFTVSGTLNRRWRVYGYAAEIDPKFSSPHRRASCGWWCGRTLVGIRTGPLVLTFFSLDFWTNSAQTATKIGIQNQSINRTIKADNKIKPINQSINRGRQWDQATNQSINRSLDAKK